MGLGGPQNYFEWDLGAFFLFGEVSREGRERRLRGIRPTTLDKWLKKATPDDTGGYVRGQGYPVISKKLH